MMLRRCRRAVALAFALLMCMVRLGLRRLRGPLALQDRALWLQESCRGVLASLGITVRVDGQPPTRGLVVSNHLSYMDIAVCASVMQCAFISKKEVGQWPFFGFAARSAGTVFIDRGSRSSAEAVALEIGGRLRQPVPILLFPEGTSTDGMRVLRFHSTLFEPAVAATVPITAAAIRYWADGAIPERDLCWFGDEGFLPHLWGALGVRGIRAELAFGKSRLYPDRRTAARETQADVEGLRANQSGILETPAGAGCSEILTST